MIGTNTSDSFSRLKRKADFWLFELTFSEVQKILKGQGIDVLVLKGPHLAHTVYDAPEERDYCDLDLLVRPGDFLRASLLLRESGYDLIKWDPNHLATVDKKYNWGFASRQGVMVELHRDLAGFGRFKTDVSSLFDRAECFYFGNVEALGLSAEDLLVHLCLHAGKSYFFTIEKKHLLDIHLLVNKKKVDWNLFVQRTKESHARVVAFYTLSAVKSQFNAPVPPRVLKHLKPGIFRCFWLDHHLDPCRFPVYRFPGHHVNQVRRRLILFEIDGVRDWLLFTLNFLWISIKDMLLRRKGIRKRWLQRHPLLAHYNQKSNISP